MQTIIASVCCCGHISSTVQCRIMRDCQCAIRDCSARETRYRPLENSRSGRQRSGEGIVVRGRRRRVHMLPLAFPCAAMNGDGPMLGRLCAVIPNCGRCAAHRTGYSAKASKEDDWKTIPVVTVHANHLKLVRVRRGTPQLPIQPLSRPFRLSPKFSN